jgi:hypothetical protein
MADDARGTDKRIEIRVLPGHEARPNQKQWRLLTLRA